MRRAIARGRVFPCWDCIINNPRGDSPPPRKEAKVTPYKNRIE